MPVIFCDKCHKLVTTVANTEEGMVIGKMKLGKNSQIKGGLTMKCPSGHLVKVLKGIGNFADNGPDTKIITEEVKP